MSNHQSVIINKYCIPVYRMARSKEDLLSELDPDDHLLLGEVVSKILAKVTATTNYEIELQIHDLILKNVKYTNKKKRTEHTIEGALLNKKAVCEGIAKTVKYLLNLKNIESEVVIGKLSKDSETFHAWNVVLIEGEWYHLDVTSDLGMTDGHSFRYDSDGRKKRKSIVQHDG